jgi:hypothetical protein
MSNDMQKSSRSPDELKQLFANLIAWPAAIWQLTYNNDEIFFTSVILILIMNALFEIWNRIEAIRFMTEYHTSKGDNVETN